MFEERTLPRMILINLFMIFISGCWTLATILPFTMNWMIRSIQLITITIADISFLLSLLASILVYSGFMREEIARKWFIIFFCIGILALIITIILFSTSYLIKHPSRPD
ncbi:MAG: hypothetical protein NDF54_07955 [archaeon GB-1867-035]|nr:hypothetical protein [Candidatus Culexmicrobium profundum]